MNKNQQQTIPITQTIAACAEAPAVQLLYRRREGEFDPQLRNFLTDRFESQTYLRNMSPGPPNTQKFG